MASEKVLFKSEERIQRREVVKFLEQIAGKIEQGEIILRRGGEELTLRLPENLVLEIKVEEEGAKRSLELELEWKEGGQESGRTTLG